MAETKTRLVLTERGEKVKRGAIKAAAGVALIGAGVFGAKTFQEAITPPTFSEETTTTTVEHGQGLYDVVENIDGIETIDRRDAVDHVANLPENQEVLKDGLQPGESVTHAERVER